jgi:hypothetical protein
MYDYYLGGKDNFPVDRAAAEEILRIARAGGADVREVARANRGFLTRAVRHAAESGVRQFLDIGTGLPTQDNVHQVALDIAPDSTIVYVDNDPMVLVHARALLAGNDAAIVLDGDVRDPAAILDAASAHLDFDRPVAIIAAAVLHFLPDDAEAAQITATLRAALAPGGYLIVSHAFIEPEALRPDHAAEARGIYGRSAAGGITWRDRETVRRYFDGLELLDPGVVPAQEWRNDQPHTPSSLVKGGILGAVGRRG